MLGLLDSQYLRAATWHVNCLSVCKRSRLLSKKAALPVILWIYGGSNVMGDVAFYGPIEHLCRNQVHNKLHTTTIP